MVLRCRHPHHGLRAGDSLGVLAEDNGRMPESLSSPLALLWPVFLAGAAPWACLVCPFRFSSVDIISRQPLLSWPEDVPLSPAAIRDAGQCLLLGSRGCL